MSPFRFLHALLCALAVGAAHAQNLSAVVVPPPEAPAVTQAAQRLLDAVRLSGGCRLRPSSSRW